MDFNCTITKSILFETPFPYPQWLCYTSFAIIVVVFVYIIGSVFLYAFAFWFIVYICITDLIDEKARTTRKEKIDGLPLYKFRWIGNYQEVNGENQESFGIMTISDTDAPTQHVISIEDAECCICLSAYDDGTELRELPCGHHFHCSCIERWLNTDGWHPLCPLCRGSTF